MQLPRRFTLIAGLGILSLVFTACGSKGPYVEVDGSRYTESDLEDEMPEYYAQVRKDYEQQLKRALKQLGEKKLFEEAADDNDMDSGEEYLNSIRQKAANPSEADLEAAYKRLKQEGQIKNQPFQQIRGQLVSYLISQSSRGLIENEKAALKKKYNFKVGPENRKKLDIKGEPALNEKGQLLIVEFSGYECPFCKKVQATTKQLREKYGDKVKWVMKDYPLRTGSIYSHMAANCVHEQDPQKFWQLFDVMYSPRSGRELLEKKNLDKAVSALGVDMERFQNCADSSDPVREEILQDHQEGVNAGVRGIPHFFINGKSLSGAQPFPVFDQMVAQELEKIK